MASSKGIRAGKAFVELGVDDRITRGLKAAEKRLKAFGAGVRAVGTKLAALGAGALTPLLGAAKAFAGAGDTLDKMAARTGVSVEALSELGFAAEQSGTDLDTLEAGLRKMQKTTVDAARGSASAQEALQLLGLTAADLAGLAPEEQFKRLADRLSQVRDPALRAALAMELFGKSGVRLLPLIKDGARGIEELQKQARELGLTISAEAAADAALLTDTLNILWRTLRNVVFTIGAALAPTLIAVADTITRVVVSVTDWLRQNRAMIVTALQVAAAVTGVGLALIVAGTLITGVGAVFGWLAAIVAGVGAVLSKVGAVLAGLVTPIGLAAAAVVVLGGTILKASGAGAAALAWLGEQFGRLRGMVERVAGGIADALAAGDIQLAAKVLWLGLKLAWQRGTGELSRVWLAAKQLFVRTAYDMWFGALAAAEIAVHGLTVAWIETTAFLSRTWTHFTAGFQKVWSAAIHWTTKKLLDLWGLFDETLDVEAAKQMADDDLSALNAEIDRQRDLALQEREARRQAERDAARGEHEAALEDIGRRDEEARRGLDDDADARVRETQAQLDEARRALDEAVAEAKRKRAEREAEGDTPGRPRDGLLDGDLLPSLSDLLARKISALGTFNPFAVQGIGSSTAAERTARATEETARNTKRLVEANSVQRFA